MTKGRYAVLLDGAFVCKRLARRLGRFPSVSEILAVAKDVGRQPELRDRELLRIYYYDSPPAVGRIRNPLSGCTINLGRTDQHARGWRLLDELELCGDVASRRGEISVRGWRVRPTALEEIGRVRRDLEPDDLIPDITQKGVDLRIGLDIARSSLLRIVDTLVIVTGDSDLVPAFKFARREGVRIFLDHMGGSVKRDLLVHVDRILLPVIDPAP